MNGMSKVIASSLSQFQFYQIPHKYSLRMDSQFMENAYEAGRLPESVKLARLRDEHPEYPPRSYRHSLDLREWVGASPLVYGSSLI